MGKISKIFDKLKGISNKPPPLSDRDFEDDEYLDQDKPKLPISVKKGGLLEDRYLADYDPLVADRYATIELGNFLALYSAHPWVYACAHAIATAAASVPFRLKTMEGTEVENADEHAPYLSKPNPNMTWFELIETTFLHLELGGNSYWEIVVDPITGQIIGIFPLRPDRMKVIPDRKKKVAGYIYNVGHGNIITYAPQEILHLKYTDAKNEFYGVPPVSAVKNEITLDFNATVWNKKFFQNGAEPGGVLQTDKSLTEQAYLRLRQNWYKRHKGLDKSHEVAILEEGLKYQQITSKHADMQYFEMKTWVRDAILVAMRVPAVILGVSQKLSVGTERDQKKTFWHDNIIPKLMKLGHVINSFLMPEDVEFEFITKAIDSIIEDDQVKTTIVQSNIAHGVMTINEAREKYYAMKPVGWGNTWWRPVGLVDVNNPVAVLPSQTGSPTGQSVTDAKAAGTDSPKQVGEIVNNNKPNGVTSGNGQDGMPPKVGATGPNNPPLYPTPPESGQPDPKPRPAFDINAPSVNTKKPPVNQPFAPGDTRLTPDDTTPSADQADMAQHGFGKFLDIEKMDIPEPNWDDKQAIRDYHEWNILKSHAGPDEKKLRAVITKFFKEQGQRLKYNLERGWPIRKDDFPVDDLMTDQETDDKALRLATVGLIYLFFKKYGSLLLNSLNVDATFDMSTEVVKNWLDSHAADLVTKINGTTKDLLRKQLLEAYDKHEPIDTLIQKIDNVFEGDVAAWRVLKIARTELMTLANNSRHLAALQSGVAVKKRWVCALIPTSRDRAAGENHVGMHNTVVKMDEKFKAPRRGGGHDMMEGPHDQSAHPENIVNCLCYTSYYHGTQEFEDINAIPVVEKAIEKAKEPEIKEKKRKQKQNINVTVNVPPSIVNNDIRMPDVKSSEVHVAPPDVVVHVEKQDQPDVIVNMAN